METSEKNLLQGAAGVILQEAISLEVDINPKSRLHRFLQDKSILPRKRILVIRPITLGNLVRISKLLLDMDVQPLLTSKNALEKNYQLLARHCRQMAEIVAIATYNQRSEPPASLVSFIEHHFTSRELLQAVTIVLKQMDLLSFMNTIISARGLAVMSPIEQGR